MNRTVPDKTAQQSVKTLSLLLLADAEDDTIDACSDFPLRAEMVAASSGNERPRSNTKANVTEAWVTAGKGSKREKICSMEYYNYCRIPEIN